MKISDLINLALNDRKQLLYRAARSNAARIAEDTRFSLRGRRYAAAMINNIEIALLGMRRSGNHAVIQWLQELGARNVGRTVFLNNLVPGDNGYRLRVWYPEKHTESEIETYQECRKKKNKPGSVGLLIRSYEDYGLKSFENGFLNPFYYGGSRQIFKCVIYRDPPNLFASRIRSGYTKTKEFDQVEMYLDNTAGIETRSDVIYINYNQFIERAAYRAELAAKLGMRDDGVPVLQNMTVYGGGSSFGDAKLDVKSLTKRYLSMSDNPQFATIMKDERILARFERLFPDQFADFRRSRDDQS